MLTSWSARPLGLTAAVLLSLSACSSGDETEEAAATPLESAAPGVYGTPLDASQPDPTDVATDAPVSTAPSADAPVEITYYGWNDATGVVELAGFVVGVVEEGGTCTLTLTKGGTSATTTAQGTANVGTTSCGEQVVPGGELSSGTWRAVLSYESGTSQGTSEPVEVQVP